MEYNYTVRERIIECKSTDVISLIPFGDVHRDTPLCDEDRWKYFLQGCREIQAENPLTLFLSTGDSHDFASFSEVRNIRNSKLHETTINKFDLMAQKDNRKFAREIDFMRGHMLGFIEGNHGWVMKNNKTATEDLAERMDSESLGWLCHYTLNFKFTDRGGLSSHNVYGVICHGKAGGYTAGSTVNQVDKLRRIFPAADFYIMAHDHERWAVPKSVLLPVSAMGCTKIKQKRQFLCRSGSFMKGFVDGQSSYVVGGLYTPSDLGSLVMRIGFHRDQRKGEDRTITDIKVIV